MSSCTVQHNIGQCVLGEMLCSSILRRETQRRALASTSRVIVAQQNHKLSCFVDVPFGKNGCGDAGVGGVAGCRTLVDGARRTLHMRVCGLVQGEGA